jgi:hypothetical protein
LIPVSGEQVNANIEIVDQIGGAQSGITYNWESGSNEPRNLNVKVSLSLNNGNIVKLDPAANVIKRNNITFFLI